MLETISKGFRAAKARFTGKTELTADVIDEALGDVRMSLLEADVGFSVVKTFMARVKDKAMGEEIQLAAKSKDKNVRITPEQAFIKICQDELTALMGPVETEIKYARKGPTGIMMVGLQGSGKTTTVGKLARYLEKDKKKVLLVAADVYRPAAIEQLKVIGEKAGVPVYSEPAGNSPPDICERGVQYAREHGRDVVIFDTAGRLTIDEPLMNELVEIDRRCKPANIFLVLDAMIGQVSVDTAKAFNERLNLEGFIMTKLDGDTRGGAALSVKEVTGKPIKFLGMGETLDKLEEFRPEGLATRILGMGDIVGLVKDFEQVVDAEKAERDARRMLKGKFDMADFLEQIRVIKKMGSLKDLFEKMPMELPEGANIDDKELQKIEAMISSMTPKERSRPELFVESSWESIIANGRQQKRRTADYAPSRVRRVAIGSGRKENEVKELLHKFAMMRQMMQQIGQSSGLLGKIPGMKGIAQAKQMMGMDFSQFMNVPGMEQGPRAGRPPIRVNRDKDKAKRKAAKMARKKNKRR